jgi:RNA polymerase sigma-70 factor, ECF subfamily
MMPMAVAVGQAVDALYRSDWGRIVATLIGLVGDFDLAEEVAQEAFTAAVNQWPEAGVPEFPRAWIIQTARHKALDSIRRRARYAQTLETYATSPLLRTMEEPEYFAEDIPDDRLRLIFTCCHPALAPEAQVALTLRTLCGLETDEIARAFLVPASTMAQRLVRAKRKIRDAGIPYRVPRADELAERLDTVLTVVYLVFTEGYASTRGASVLRTNLCAEAIRLGRLIRELTSPRTPSEVTGLIALMLLHDARRDARLDDHGDVVLLDQQDRGRWNYAQIDEALALLDEAQAGRAGQLRPTGGHRGDALPRTNRRRNRLAGCRAAVRSARTRASLTSGLAEPRCGRGDGRWSGRRARADRVACGGRRARRISPVALLTRRAAAQARTS